MLFYFNPLKLSSVVTLLQHMAAKNNRFILPVILTWYPFVLQIDQVELWEAQSKNPGPLGYQLSQGTTAFAEELQAQDLVFRTNGGLITDILAHPEDPSHVLNIKRGILSALQVQFVDEPATLDEVRSSYSSVLFFYFSTFILTLWGSKSLQTESANWRKSEILWTQNMYTHECVLTTTCAGRVPIHFRQDILLLKALKVNKKH